MEKKIVFDMTSDTSKLKDLSDFVQNNMSPYVKDKAIMDDIIISIDEVATNIILHAYNKKGGMPIRLEISTSDSIAHIVFHHKGVTFNPSDVDKPILSKEMATREINGMGLYIVNKFMDHVEYRFKNKDCEENIIILTKKLKK